MNHRVGDFDAGGPAVEDDSADFGLEDVDEVGPFLKVGGRAVDGGGEVAVKIVGGGEDFFARLEMAKH